MSAAAACHDFSGEPVGPQPTVIADKDLVARAFGNASADGLPWLALLGVFALIYIVIGAIAYGPLLEET